MLGAVQVQPSRRGSPENVAPKTNKTESPSATLAIVFLFPGDRSQVTR